MSTSATNNSNNINTAPPPSVAEQLSSSDQKGSSSNNKQSSSRVQKTSSIINIICTAYASLAFFSLWIPAYFCSVLTNKITNLFGWDVQKSLTSVFMRWSSRIAVKLNPFWTVRTMSTDKAPKENGRYVFICNHQSNMDPILINSVFRYNAKWVSKDSIFNVPFGKFVIRLTFN